MGTKKKPIAWLLFGLWAAWTFVGQPIWNLNIERVAEQSQIDATLAGFAPMSWLREIAEYLPSSFAAGFVLGALIFAYWDNIISLLRRRFSKEGEAPEMRAWVGSIVPHFEPKSHKVSLWFRVVSVGAIPIKIASIEGAATLRCVKPSGGRATYRLTEARFEHLPDGPLVEQGYIASFSVAFQAPAEFWNSVWDVFFWKPLPSLELSDLTIWLESERGTKKKLTLWDSMRLSSGEDQIRCVETMRVWESDEEKENFQKSLGAVVKRFGVSL